MYVNIYFYIHIYICIHVIHVYIYIYIHTYTYYIHIHIAIHANNICPAAICCQERKKPQCRGPESCRKKTPCLGNSLENLAISHGFMMIYGYFPINKEVILAILDRLDDFLSKKVIFLVILMTFWWKHGQKHVDVETWWKHRDIQDSIAQLLAFWHATGVLAQEVAVKVAATTVQNLGTGTWIRTNDVHGSWVWISPWHLLP